MKKLIILILPILLFSCFGESDEVKKAKDELLNSDSGTVNNEIITETGNTDTQNEITEETKESSYYEVNYLTADKFIDIQNIANVENITDLLDIKGIVNNPDIEKIKVSFENSTSKFPIDSDYELKTFKKGDTSFLYRAYKKYEVLDYGLNKYTIDAYVGDNLVSKIEINLFIADKTNTIEKLPQENTNSDENIITYTGDILESIATNSDELAGVNCENLSDYLKENYTWYYWNACRPINQDDAFSVNILSLSGEEYKYEKHYFSTKSLTHFKILLEKGTGVSQSDMQTKNDELKTKTYDSTESADKLFKDLLTNN